MIEIIDQINDKNILKKTAEHFAERRIILPTFSQLRSPHEIPENIKNELSTIGLWDLHPLNLFRINWKNEPVPEGGLFSKVNVVELPQTLTGVPARILVLIGKWFPTGAHKVGAAYGCLAPQIVTGRFDPTYHKAVWPSTGNYCRGGAFDSYLMGCQAVAILPEEMSRERFDWLAEIGAEIIKTPGCESNVKEIYDKCWEIRRTRRDAVIFNQFDEFGNCVWHYNVTGSAIEEMFNNLKDKKNRLAAYVSATGSAGTIAAGDYLRTIHPRIKIVASEALQCPTLLMNGFGGHRIEGIGDKHVPWIHNVRNTDVVSAIDDEDCMRLLRLFNEKEGHQVLKNDKIPENIIADLSLLGISAIANILASIKTAKYFEMTEDDVIVTIATDSAEMYQSRLRELNTIRGEYNINQAGKDLEKCLLGTGIDYLKELTYPDKKAIHNLKYYTWIEQQEKDVNDLNQLWEDQDIWDKIFNQHHQWDHFINEFNQMTGLLKTRIESQHTIIFDPYGYFVSLSLNFSMILLQIFLFLFSTLNLDLIDQMVIFESFEDLDNWESFEFSGSKNTTNYRIISEDSMSYLQASSQSSASGLILKTRFNAKNYPVLQWRWQIEHANCDVDGREKSGDDYPLRIFVLFDDDSADFSFWESLGNSAIRLLYGFEVPESSLCFVWTNIVYDEKYFNNPHSDRVKIIPLTASNDTINKWATHRIRIDSVFKNIYNRSCPEKAALAIMSDTDNTGGSAIANLDYIKVGK